MLLDMMCYNAQCLLIREGWAELAVLIMPGQCVVWLVGVGWGWLGVEMRREGACPLTAHMEKPGMRTLAA